MQARFYKPVIKSSVLAVSVLFSDSFSFYLCCLKANLQKLYVTAHHCYFVITYRCSWIYFKHPHNYCTYYNVCYRLGSYYVYDNPSALQDVMKKDLKISTAQFTSLYAVYSYPNVILCCFGGFLIDRVFGIRLGALLFCLLVTVGQVCSYVVGMCMA